MRSSTRHAGTSADSRLAIVDGGLLRAFRSGRGVLAALVLLMTTAARLELVPTPEMSQAMTGLPLPGSTSRAGGTAAHSVDSPVTAGAHGSALAHRIRSIGESLVRGLDQQTADPIPFSFHVDSVTTVPRSYSYPDGRIVVTATMSHSLARDSWLATVLAYEIASLLRDRTAAPHADLHALAIRMMTRAGYDPREIAVMEAWIERQTSLANRGADFAVGVRLAEQIDNGIRRSFPHGLPEGLRR